MAVSLPVVLLILDWYPFGKIRSLKSFRQSVVHKLPFVALTVISSILTILAQKSTGAIASMEAIPFSTRVLVAAKSLIVYVWKMILPLNLVPYYPYPQNVPALSPEYLPSIFLVVGITAICLVIAGRQKLWLSVWGYYVLTLIPVLGIIQVGGQSMADRYTYLPSLGPFLVIGVVAALSLCWVNTLKRWKRIFMIIGAATAILLFVSLSYLTVKQVRIWSNSIDLWNYVIQKEPEKVPLIYYSRGIALKKMGHRNKAIEDFDTVIAIDPTYYRAYNYRGILYGEAGSFDKAIEYFNQSIAINPKYANAYANRAFTYAIIGQYDRALEDYTKAIELNQSFAEAYFNRGNIHLRTGETGLALSDFQKGCDLADRKSCNSLAALRPMMMPDQKKE
jgi:Tfp pilus assembly protein PilF